MDIADESTLDQAAMDLKETARNLYWSRLPALVLFPPHLAAQDATFRKNGMISPCLTKPADTDELLQHVLKGRAH